MDIKLNYCTVTGVKHPRILVEGWITSDIESLELYCNNQIIWEENYYYVGTKAHPFTIAREIPKTISLELVAISGEKRKRLAKIPAHVGIRLINSYKSRSKNDKDDVLQELLVKNMPSCKTYDPFVDAEYQQWLVNRKEEIVNHVELKYQPLISIIIPVYNIGKKYLEECLDSILEQTYQNFEICIADDCSTNQETIDTLKRYEKQDVRIKVCYRQKNGHISLATNSALAMAKGEYIGLVDNDDILDKTALAEVVKVLNDDASLDFIYTDEDKLDYNGKRVEPHFKPDFAFDNFLVSNYICHFSVIRRKCVEEIGGFRKGYEGAQDYDLFLRIIKKTRRIYHIPKVLYQWRKIPGSTSVAGDSSKNYAVDAGIRALRDFFEDESIKAYVESIAGTIYKVSYPCYEEPMVDIVIESDNLDSIKRAIEMWITHVAYNNYRFVIISKNEVILKKLKDYKKVVDICRVRNSADFNKYAYFSKSKHFLFWNVDDMIDDSDWLKVMVSYVNNQKIGAVGSNVLNEKTREFASGFIIVNKHKAIPVRYGYIAIGYSPVNRCIVGKNVYMVSKQHFLEVEGFDTKLDMNAKHYDFQIKLHNAYRRNVVLPQIYYMQKEEIGWEEYLPEMESMGCFEKDPWYNPNFSDVIAYKL